MSSKAVVDNALNRQVRLDGAAGRDEAELRADRARTKVGEIDLIRHKLAASADGHLERAADRILESGVDRRMPVEQYKSFESSVQRAAAYARLDDTLAELQRTYEKRERDPKVVREPRTYGPESPESYFRDAATVVAGEGEVGAFRHQAATERLARHSVEVSYEMRARSKEGRYAERVLREATRSADPEEHRRRSTETIAIAREQRASGIRETRALLTGGGITASAPSGAAAFVSPYIILSEWAAYRGIHRCFADQCHNLPLPTYGTEVYIPSFTSTTSVTQQTEGSGVSETDPSTGLQGAQVVTQAGQVTISMQLHDRGVTGGGSFDILLSKQLQQQLDEKINAYVVAQAISGGTPVAGSATFSIANFYQDLAKGREVLVDTAGTRLRPTHVFTTGDLYSFVTRQVDATTNRPIVTPQFAPGFPLVKGADDPDAAAWSRFTGTVLPASVLWFEDDTIPASGSNTQILISAPNDAIVLLEPDAPTLAVFPQDGAANLEVVVSLRKYVAAITRHSGGTAILSGAAYPTSSV